MPRWQTFSIPVENSYFLQAKFYRKKSSVFKHHWFQKEGKYSLYTILYGNLRVTTQKTQKRQKHGGLSLPEKWLPHGFSPKVKVLDKK